MPWRRFCHFHFQSWSPLCKNIILVIRAVTNCNQTVQLSVLVRKTNTRGDLPEYLPAVIKSAALIVTPVLIALTQILIFIPLFSKQISSTMETYSAYKKIKVLKENKNSILTSNCKKVQRSGLFSYLWRFLDKLFSVFFLILDSVDKTFIIKREAFYTSI